jgi:hypothetical protein
MDDRKIKQTDAIAFHFVPCTGEAHSNGHIDNCMICAPFWGRVPVPTHCTNLSEWRNFYSELSDDARKAHARARRRFEKAQGK